MKELILKPLIETEISVKKKQQIEKSLVGNIQLHNGHKLWEIDNVTLEICEAKLSNVTAILFGGNVKKEILVKDGCSYVGASNRKNAIKKFNKNSDGSKPIWKNPLIL